MNPLLVLQARAEARALLFKTAEYEDLGHAITPLLVYAHVSGLEHQVGAELVWGIIKTAFKEFAKLDVTHGE